MSARDRLASYIGYEPGENDEKFTALLDAVVAERDAEIIAWLGKKAKEYRSDPERRESAGDAIERMASKISRGAVRAAAGQAPTPEPEAVPEPLTPDSLEDIDPGGAGWIISEDFYGPTVTAEDYAAPQPETAPGADGLRERIKQALSNAGAFCGDDCCAFQPGDRGCPDCERHWDRCADALMPVLTASAESGAES